MAFLFYTNSSGKTKKQLQEIIHARMPGEEMEVYRTFDSLSNRLLRPLEGLSVAVLLVSSMEDLSNILTLCNVLWDMRLILILPDRNHETIMKGHQLRPRFLTHADCNPTEVAEVLCNMLKKYTQMRPF
ncbi:MAG TPA: hypothetical protein DDY17_01605 [Syntrophaceae bacterium]|nr:hypothetical protein [Syntrophaceae bacterium]